MSRNCIASLAAVAAILAPPAYAAVIVDQSTIPETGHHGFAGGQGLGFGSGGYAQSFTVGVSGWLDHVAVAVQHWTFQGPAADIRFELLDASFDVLFAADVESGDLPEYTFDGFDWEDTLTFDVRAAGINVHAGETYLLKVTASGPLMFGQVWLDGYDNGTSNIRINYAGGKLYSWEDPGPTPVIFDDLDMGFRSYVDEGVFAPPAAAPEPAAWGLMIGGFGLAGVALRRRCTPALTRC